MNHFTNQVAIVLVNQDVWAPLNNLKTLMLTGLSAAGVIVMIFAIIQFATALASHDTSQKIGAVMVFVAGALLFSAGLVLTFLTGTPVS